MVVMSRKDYVSKAMCHLNNKEHYRKLEDDRTHDFLEEIRTVTSEMVHCHSIEKDTAHSLILYEVSVHVLHLA